jgi:dihydropyrimidinase
VSPRLTIRGGLVVTPGGVRKADVEVAGEIVARLLPASGEVPRGARGRGGRTADIVIDATGCYVLPGGIDPHTHILAGVAAGSTSAAFGGTTTALCFTNPRPGESAPDAVVRGRTEVEGRAAIDIDLHAIIGDPERVTSDDIERLKRLHVRAVKVFLAFPEQGLMASDGSLYEVMRSAARLGLMTKVHCENGSVIDALTRDFLVRGRRGPAFFAHARPPDTEDEAIVRAMAIARLAGAVLYVTHMTTSGGMGLLRAARARGQVVHGEVCMHHLLLDAGKYGGRRAARFLVAPPLRSPEHVKALWSALADGTVDTIASDHSQVRYQPPPAADFTGLGYGFAGIEMRLPLLLSEGLRRGLSIRRIAELGSTRPAQVFGLYPRKGSIRPGSDADLVVWDPRPRWKVKAAALHDGIGESPYEGMSVRGVIRSVFVRGRMVVANGELAAPSSGRCLIPRP